MHKHITLILLLVSLGIFLTGAVAAAPDVNVSVVDENGAPVAVTNPGSEVNITLNATTDEYLSDPAVLITLKPESGLEFKEDEAVMIYDGDTFTNDPEDPFFYWSDTFHAWIWWIGWLYGDQYPEEDAQLSVPATVSKLGEITVNASYMGWDLELDEPVLVAADSYTFLSAQSGPVAVPDGKTIPMQDTGAPLGVAALGLLSIIGGALYGKLR